MTKKVLITDYVWPSVEPEKAVLAAGGAMIIVAPNGDEDTLVELAKDVDGILTCFAKVTERVVRAAEKCVVIGRYGVGVDNIDVDTATELGIAVTYVPDYCIPEVSDHVMAMLLSWNRRIVFFDRATKTKGWGTEGLGMRIMRLEGKKLGIVGFGRIGRAVADRARAFGLQLLVADPFVTAEAAQEVGAVKMELPELLGESEFVTLHSPLMPQTQGMMGKDEFARMRPDSFLINAARGGLIDEDALYDALTSGQIAGAGLDVLVDVDPPLDHRISQLENVIITPHTAFFSQEAVLELEERAAGEVVSIFQGKMPDNLVNPAVLDHSRTKID
ncbi:MAG: C-terminal binding protein [SAR202 cluster bacterium]|jgi:D-3-phosphoglycerate dehydrogenase|nr:C-terminal binding protein [SAR202 cluster bacterium]